MLTRNHYLMLLVGISFLFISPIKGQDRFFSQFYSHPISLNPALTGTMNGTFRANAALRQQWNQVLQTPYSTFTAGVDTRIKISSSSFNHDRIGAGVVFSHDQFGTYDFNANAIAFTGAYHKDVTAGFPQTISLGFQIGIEQRATSYNNFVFEDQYLLGSGYVLSTAEQLPDNQLAFLDLSLGINYSATFNQFDQFFAGISMWHVNRPNISFYANINNLGSPVEVEALLKMRYTGHIGLNLRLSEQRYLSPRMMLSVQGDHLATNIGANYRFNFEDVHESHFHIGGATRLVKNTDAIGLDAIILMIAYGRDNYKIGLSYDAQVNDLQNEFVGQGTYEITLSITGDYEGESLFCPEF